MSAIRRRREEGGQGRRGASGRQMRTIPKHLDRSQETIRADCLPREFSNHTRRPAGGEEPSGWAVEPVVYPNQRWARRSA